jgi:nucleotide-binding universal stress UspA family protein
MACASSKLEHAQRVEGIALALRRQAASLAHDAAWPTPGPAGDNVAAAAEKQKFDLVIMGSHGQGTLGNLVMGSVAGKVLAHCKVPVLLVR